MNTKTYRFYKALFEFAGKRTMSAEAAAEFFNEALAFDFNVASELWDYLITDAERSGNSGEWGSVLGGTVLECFCTASLARAQRLVVDSAVIKNFIYGTYAGAAEGCALDIAVYFLTGSKLDDAEEILRAVVKNAQLSVGQAMKNIVEGVFDRLAFKAGGARPVLSRKLSALLLTYIGKIKGAERALLEQRINEVI